MALRFIYGRSGTGKSYYCINQIKKKIESGTQNKLILIVPEQFTFRSENKMLNMIGEKSILTAEVLSFKRMAHIVSKECGGITHKVIKDAGKNMMIHKILEENQGIFKYFTKATKQMGFTEIVNEVLTELKKYNIEINEIDELMENLEQQALKDKLYDISLIYKKLEEEIKKSYLDPADELTILSNKLKSCTLFDGAEVWIDEFTTFTPQQYEVIRMLMKKCKTVNVTLTSNGRSSNELNIFTVTDNTEKRLVKIAAEENISYLEPINLNKINYRFMKSKELLHLEQNLYAYPYKEYKDNIKNLRLYKANNSYDEVTFIAKDILKKVRDNGYRYKDISIVCRNIEDYEKVATVILKEYDIPFYIDKKIDILSNPIIVLINALFDIIQKNWDYESVFKYLKTGLVNIDREYIDIIENYVLANGIKGYRWTSDNEWEIHNNSVFVESDNEENEKLSILINEIKDEIRTPIIKFQDKVRKKNTIKYFCQVLYEFLLENNILHNLESWIDKFTELGLKEEEKEYSEIVDIINEVLDQAVEVLGDEEVDSKKFIKILNAGFEKYEMGIIPLALDQVTVGDITRIRSNEVKILYILGVNDGVLPSTNKQEGILSDRDREVLKDKGIELAADTKSKIYEEELLVYTVFTIPSEYLIITYSMANFEGKSLRPSIIIPRIKRIFPKLIEESEIYNLDNDKFKGVTTLNPTFNELISIVRKRADGIDVDEYWRDVYNWYIDNDNWNKRESKIIDGINYSNMPETLSREKIKKIYEARNGKLIFSVSRLESYAQCPFAYYVKYGLKAKDRKVYELNAPDLGTFMHQVLDEFTNRVRKNNLSFSDLTTVDCKNMVSEIVDEKLDNNKNSILNSSKKFKYFTNRFKNILTKAVTVITEQMRRSDFEIFKNEYSFGSFTDAEPIKYILPSGEEVYLTGRVDRIDMAEIDGKSYIRIIDYKSSSKNFDINELYYGIQMQLLVYLDALIKILPTVEHIDALPGAILYFRIDDPIIKSSKNLSDDKIQEEIMKALMMRGLILKDAKLVKAMDKGIDGYSLVIPAGFKKDGDFTRNSSVADENEINIIREYVNHKIISICEEMLSGDIQIKPIKEGKNTACTYCDYVSVCQFDLGIADNKYKSLKIRKKDEVINIMKDELGIGGEEDGSN